MEVNFENLNKIDDLLFLLKEIKSNQAKHTDKIWLSTRELSIYLDYSEDRIHKLKGTEFIEGEHYFKTSGKLLFKKRSINKWVQGITRTTRTQSKVNINSLVEEIMK